MADILQFKKPRGADKTKGKTLCRPGFHKWAISKQQQFDTKQGRLVTVYVCERCAAVKTTAH